MTHQPNGHKHTDPASITGLRRLAACEQCRRPIVSRRAALLRADDLPMLCPPCADAREQTAQ